MNYLSSVYFRWNLQHSLFSKQPILGNPSPDKIGFCLGFFLSWPCAPPPLFWSPSRSFLQAYFPQLKLFGFWSFTLIFLEKCPSQSKKSISLSLELGKGFILPCKSNCQAIFLKKQGIY